MKQIGNLSMHEAARRRNLLERQNWLTLYPRLSRYTQALMVRYGLNNHRKTRQSAPEDYVDEVVVKYLEGIRNFDRTRVEFPAFMHQSIRSLIGSEVKRLNTSRLVDCRDELVNYAESIDQVATSNQHFAQDFLGYLSKHSSTDVTSVATSILGSENYSNKSIARDLDLSEHRVRNCKHSLRQLIKAHYPEILRSAKSIRSYNATGKRYRT